MLANLTLSPLATGCACSSPSTTAPGKTADIANPLPVCKNRLRENSDIPVVSLAANPA
jgi:hypothetical protein